LEHGEGFKDNFFGVRCWIGLVEQRYKKIAKVHSCALINRYKVSVLWGDAMHQFWEGDVLGMTDVTHSIFSTLTKIKSKLFLLALIGQAF